jgi:hypothetical protein
VVPLRSILIGEERFGSSSVGARPAMSIETRRRKRRVVAQAPEGGTPSSASFWNDELVDKALRGRHGSGALNSHGTVATEHSHLTTWYRNHDRDFASEVERPNEAPGVDSAISPASR